MQHWRGNPLQVSENRFRTCRGRCPHRPKMKKCAYIHTLKKCFGAGSSGGNVLVPARTLRRSRLKGRCRKAAPLSIPRPLRRRHVRIFRVAMGGFIGALTVYTHRLSSRDDEGIVPYEFLIGSRTLAEDCDQREFLERVTPVTYIIRPCIHNFNRPEGTPLLFTLHFSLFIKNWARGICPAPVFSYQSRSSPSSPVVRISP